MSDRPAAQRTGHASLFDTVRAVAASFFGVRGRREHEQDMARLNPLAVIGVGIAMAAVFVLSLLAVVKFAVGS